MRHSLSSAASTIQVIGVKNVNAHTGQRLLASPCIAGIRRFFDKNHNLVASSTRHHAERRRFFDRYRHTGRRATRALFKCVIDQHYASSPVVLRIARR